MTDIQTPPAPAQVQIGLGAQYIKDFSFENPHAPRIFADLQAPPQLGVTVDVMTRGLNEGAYESVLKLKVDAKAGDKVVFIAELAYGGVFGLPAHLSEEQIALFLLVEAPRLLFPFARAIIANAVREAGFPAVTLQPIDFMSLYAAQRAGVGAMTAAGAA